MFNIWKLFNLLTFPLFLSKNMIIKPNVLCLSQSVLLLLLKRLSHIYPYSVKLLKDFVHPQLYHMYVLYNISRMKQVYSQQAIKITLSCLILPAGVKHLSICFQNVIYSLQFRQNSVGITWCCEQMWSKVQAVSFLCLSSHGEQSVRSGRTKRYPGNKQQQFL